MNPAQTQLYFRESAKAGEAYARRICQDPFGHFDLDRLTLAELRQLSLTIRTRRAATTPAHQELAAA